MTANEKLRELMDWLGIKQQQLADLSGIPRGTINSYVLGHSAISVEAANKLAHAMGVTPWSLLNCEPLPATPTDLTPAEAELVSDLRGLTRKQSELLAVLIGAMKQQNRRGETADPTPKK